jgi:alkylhydroperoxidase/carboxymuconolactone decarboxylase family protein YurZ
MDGHRYAQGVEVYARQFQIPRDQVAAWFADYVGARFGEEAILAAAGAWVDDELSLGERSLVGAALITQGGAEQHVRAHTRWATNHGCTRAQLEALATLLGVYTGYPRASQGLMVMREDLATLEQADASPHAAAPDPSPDLRRPGPRLMEGVSHG